jgi:hypothetical protein
MVPTRSSRNNRGEPRRGAVCDEPRPSVLAAYDLGLPYILRPSTSRAFGGRGPG